MVVGSREIVCLNTCPDDGANGALAAFAARKMKQNVLMHDVLTRAPRVRAEKLALGSRDKKKSASTAPSAGDFAG